MGGAEGDEGGHIERAHPDNLETGDIGRKAQVTGVFVVEGRRGHNPDTVQKRAQLLEDAPFRDGQYDGFVKTGLFGAHNEVFPC